MLRVPPFVVTATSSVPAAAARRADSMMAPVTVSELFGLITMIFTAPIVPLPPSNLSWQPSRHNGVHVAEIWRYPVKSMAGERLPWADVTPRGVWGDRIVQGRDRRGHTITSRTHHRLLRLS